MTLSDGFLDVAAARRAQKCEQRKVGKLGHVINFNHHVVELISSVFQFRGGKKSKNFVVDGISCFFDETPIPQIFETLTRSLSLPLIVSMILDIICWC